jgi:16S rRNA processing protein RimM
VRLVVGRIGRPHGVAGDVAVEPRTDDPDIRFAAGAVLFTQEDGPAALTVDRHRWHSGRLLVRFAGVEDRGAAEALRNTLLRCDAADRVEEDGAWYLHELVGLQVRCRAEPVGSIAEVLNLPGQDVLVVRLARGGAERLVPFVAELVPVVDVAAGFVTVADQPGLLADEPEPA